jgi:hypothetical protein
MNSLSIFTFPLLNNLHGSKRDTVVAYQSVHKYFAFVEFL